MDTNKILTYKDSVLFLDSLINFEKQKNFGGGQFDLENFSEFMKFIGSPQNSYRSVTITGTKGKGSTAVFLEAALRSTGKKVGLYTSPHLLDLRERIQVNRELISEEDFAGHTSFLKEKHKSWIEQGAKSLSYYEVFTALALLYFAEHKVDIAVLEVGLGGRLDAVRVAPQELSLITPISIDHTAVLGNTIEKIAAEKAGIFRKKAPVFSAPQTKEAENVLIQKAKDVGVPIEFVDPRSSCNLLDLIKSYKIEIPLKGFFQRTNLNLALKAFVFLFPDFDIRSLKKNIESIKWPGRLQLIDEKPTMILDGAHNGDSASVLMESVKELYKYDKLALIYSTLVDKEYESVINILSPAADIVFYVEGDSPRKLDTASAKNVFSKVFDGEIIFANDVSAAIKEARNVVGERGLVLITGSLTLVAKVLGLKEYARYGL